MKNQKISLYSGAKNKFALVLAAPNENQKSLDWISRQSQKLNVDGILFLEPLNRNGVSENQKFKWHFYNSDGSSAEMCGNAARCATMFLHKEHGASLPIHFLTEVGPVEGRLNNNSYAVLMPKPSLINKDLRTSIPPIEKSYFFVNTGVPHLVWDLSDRAEQLFTDKDLWRKEIMLLRRAPEVGDRGANITLVSLSGPNKKAVTYERGVENFTEACGTGAVAAALYFQSKDQKTRQEIDMPGGKLEITINSEGVLLSGPTEKMNSTELDGAKV
jgi:diaminopimelate epimerase